MKKKSLKSIPRLKKIAWSWFSKYIRLKYSSAGYAECVTCRQWKPWKQLQAGHFVSGRGNSILFDERNVHPQCFLCNIILKGRWPEYYEFMIKTYGLETVTELLKLKKKTLILLRSDFQNLIDRYSILAKELIVR